MMLTQMGSLNSLEQDRDNSFWAKWLGRDLPSADTIGRGFSKMDLDSIRSSLHHVYSRLKRNKAIRKTHGFHVLIIDGHEHTSSYLRCCSTRLLAYSYAGFKFIPCFCVFEYQALPKKQT